jgi:hypothetical protein
MENNCWKPGFAGDSADWELCKAPDKTMVRVDYVGWLVVFIVGTRLCTCPRPVCT